MNTQDGANHQRIQQSTIETDPESNEDPIPSIDSSLLSSSFLTTTSSTFCNNISALWFPCPNEESKCNHICWSQFVITMTWFSWFSWIIEFKNKRTYIKLKSEAVRTTFMNFLFHMSCSSFIFLRVKRKYIAIFWKKNRLVYYIKRLIWKDCVYLS